MAHAYRGLVPSHVRDYHDLTIRVCVGVSMYGYCRLYRVLLLSFGIQHTQYYISWRLLKKKKCFLFIPIKDSYTGQNIFIFGQKM